MENTFGVTSVSDLKVNQSAKFSNGNFTVLAIVAQEDTYNIGRVLLKKERSGNLQVAWVRKNGYVSTPQIARSFDGNFKVSQLDDYVKNLENYGAKRVDFIQTI